MILPIYGRAVARVMLSLRGGLGNEQGGEHLYGEVSALR